MNRLFKWLASLWRKPIVIKPPVHVNDPPVVPPVEPTVVVPTAECGCELSKPVIKEHREQGHRNDNEGSRNFRTCTDADRGGWFFVDPFSAAWLKGCIETDGRVLRCRCNPATGAHFAGWRNSGDPDRDSDPIRPPVPEFQIKPIAHVYFEHRKVAGTEPVSEQGDDAVVPSTGNVPPFASVKDIPDTGKPHPAARLARQGEFHGSIRVGSAAEATDCRFELLNWFAEQGIATGYPTAGNKKSGCVNVTWPTDLPKDDPREVTWMVNP